MSLGLAYWVGMFIWVIFGVWTNWPNYKTNGWNLMLFILLVLLGWKVFGPPLHE